MILLKGSLINAILILCGSLIGLVLRKGIPEKVKNTIMQAMALSVILIGLQMAIKSTEILVLIFSMGLGALLGELVDIEKRLEQLGNYLEKKLSKSGGELSTAFVTSSLVYCVGAMAIMGALQSGLEGNHTTLIAKGFIDGITSIVFTASLGIGVMLSAVPVFLYQGSLTLLAGLLNQFLTPAIILEMSAAGGLLIAAIGFNLLGMTKIKVGNLLPAIFMPIFIMQLMALWS